MIILDDKDPWEDVVAEFVFAGKLASIDSATVSVSVIDGGDDPDVADVLDGALQISDTSVFQRIKAGVDGVNYKLRCQATKGSDQRVEAGVLPVRTA